MYLPSDLQVGSWPLAWVTGAIYAGVVGLVAVIVCLLLPSMRFMLEAVAISRLLLSLAVLAAPGLGPMVLSNPALTAGIIVLGGIAVRRLLHGRVLPAPDLGPWPRLLPEGGLRRVPLRVEARPWQARYTGWIDGSSPAR
ncbi:MAG: hypothetical protein OIF48_19775 [Silicimonas sp.]|nr:hypothetical protein [Silicimonas sp.]